jgi:hypothetical protein
MPWDGNLFGYVTPPAGPVMPSPTPSPTPSPSPVPTQQPGQQTPQQLAQWVQQLLAGNAGGAEGNHGAFGGGGSGSNGGGGGGLFGSNGGIGGINLGPVGAGLLAGSTMLPGWAGMGMTALQAALRGVNTINTNQVRGSQGIPDTDPWQFVGSILGLNNYGGLGGNRTIANPDQLGQRLSQVPAYNVANSFFGRFGAPAETEAGATYSPGPGGLLGFVMRTFGLTEAEARSMSPEEINHLINATTDPDIAALWGRGGNAGGANSPGAFGGYSADARANQIASGSYPRNPGNSGGASNNSGSQSSGGNFGGVPSGFRM